MHDHEAILNKLMNTDTTVVSAPVRTAPKKHLTASEVAQFLREREAKGLSPLDKLPWVVRQISRGVKFDGCGAPDCQLGIYVGTQYVRICHRCKGKGVMDAKDTARHYTWQQATLAGKKKSSYVQHNENNPYAPAV